MNFAEAIAEARGKHKDSLRKHEETPARQVLVMVK
jgi:high-affinity K+ transport system ATPase subunit B